QTLAVDLLNPLPETEKKSHKLKRLVQSPDSYFMDVKCPGCFAITTVFSHAQTVVLCGACASVLCQPTGGKARLTEGEQNHSPGICCTADTYFRELLPTQELSLLSSLRRICITLARSIEPPVYISACLLPRLLHDRGPYYSHNKDVCLAVTYVWAGQENRSN
ncbi:ribosomal protein S27-domain-containing protein, partial [Fomitopsis betulina]